MLTAMQVCNGCWIICREETHEQNVKHRWSVFSCRFDLRRESGATEAIEPVLVPPIFRNALHVAIQHDSLDVLKLLLKYGIGK